MAEKWSEAEIRKINSLSIDNLSKPIPSPSNSISENVNAILLGEKLFFDARLSGDKKTACASCHQPNRYFTDGKKNATSRSATDKVISRNTPSLIGGAYQDWFYWDGRRDSLWSQALTPLEAPEEMAGDRLSIVRLILDNKPYRKAYQEIFKDDQNIIVLNNLPDRASPYGNSDVQNAWHSLSSNQQKKINVIFSRVGKIIAAYERTLLPKKSKFDRYAQALNNKEVEKANSILTKQERNGLKLFIDDQRTRCLQCHNGPLFTNGGFHNIGTGRFKELPLDFGRSLGMRAVLIDEFNCLGVYSDAKAKDCSSIRYMNQDPHRRTEGAYKTPSLRGLKYTAPYFHDGRATSLVEVIEHYLSPKKDTEIVSLELNENEKSDIIYFLETL